jgi:hypothetical protein
MALCCYEFGTNVKDSLDAFTLAQLHGNAGPVWFVHVSHSRYPLARKGASGLIFDALPEFWS